MRQRAIKRKNAVIKNIEPPKQTFRRLFLVMVQVCHLAGQCAPKRQAYFFLAFFLGAAAFFAAFLAAFFLATVRPPMIKV